MTLVQAELLTKRHRLGRPMTDAEIEAGLKEVESNEKRNDTKKLRQAFTTNNEQHESVQK